MASLANNLAGKELEQSFDVVVIGAGLAGLRTAELLSALSLIHI